mgnify:CR=1 FL=1
MAEFLEGIATAVGEIVKMMGSVTTGLLSNNLFQLGLAIAITCILIGIVSKLVKKGRR